MGAPLDPAHVRRRLARAGLAARAGRPQRGTGRAARLPGGAPARGRAPHHKPAGPRHHRSVDPRLRHRSADPRLRDAAAPRRAHRMPRHERAGRGQRPRVTQHARGARRRPVRGERPEGVDVGRQLRRVLLPFLPHGSRPAEAQGHQHPAPRHGHARRHRAAAPRDHRSRAPGPQRGVLLRRRDPGREPGRRAQQRMGDGQRLTRPRTRHGLAERGHDPRGRHGAPARGDPCVGRQPVGDRAGGVDRPGHGALHRRAGRPLSGVPRIRPADPRRHRAGAGAHEGVRQRDPPRAQPRGLGDARRGEPSTPRCTPASTTPAPGWSPTSVRSARPSPPGPRRSSATSSRSACSAFLATEPRPSGFIRVLRRRGRVGCRGRG